MLHRVLIVVLCFVALAAALGNCFLKARVKELEQDVKLLKDRRWVQVPHKWNRILVEVPRGGNQWDGFDLPQGAEVYVADDKEMVLVLPTERK
jgi:hypothetical protein